MKSIAERAENIIDEYNDGSINKLDACKQMAILRDENFNELSDGLCDDKHIQFIHDVATVVMGYDGGDDIEQEWKDFSKSMRSATREDFDLSIEYYKWKMERKKNG